MALTPEQLARLAYGVAHNLLQQSLDNGDLHGVEIDEYAPRGYTMEDDDYEDIKNAIEGLVMTDLFEEAAKRDV